MKIDRQIEQIINESLPAISRGEQSLESIVEKYPQLAAELQPRLEAAIWLQDARFAMSTRPGYIHDSRKYLETRIKSLQPTGFWQRLFMRYKPGRWVFNFSAPIVIILLITLIINSFLLTARLSLPGDSLYTAKLFIEDVRLVATFNQLERANLNIQYSHERTTEFVNLVLEGDYELLPSAAAQLETEIIASLRSINDIQEEDFSAEQQLTASLRETLSNEIFMLNVLKGSSPPSAAPGIELAIQATQTGLMALR